MASDTLVVETAPLSRMVKEFEADWERTRPRAAAGRFAGGSERTFGHVSAISWLVTQTSAPWISPSGKGIPRKTIEKIRDCVDPTVPGSCCGRVTELRVAEALVAALGDTDPWHDGTLTVRTRAVRMAARGSCCGGSSRGRESLTGVVR